MHVPLNLLLQLPGAESTLITQPLVRVQQRLATLQRMKIVE